MSSTSTPVSSPIIVLQKPDLATYSGEFTKDSSSFCGATDISFEPDNLDPAPFFDALPPLFDIPSTSNASQMITTDFLIDPSHLSPSLSLLARPAPLSPTTSVSFDALLLDSLVSFDSTSSLLPHSIKTEALQPIDILPPSDSSYVLLSLDSLIIVDDSDLICMDDKQDSPSRKSIDAEDLEPSSSGPDMAENLPHTGFLGMLQTLATKLWHGIKSWVGWD
ncbi:hypothetical protein NLI96_g2363 [Meripilus lineatus]|uniref:Uncharacterized protein n=1 Tax=Meripilus lineatus TaxID=2056292 RepID=A0AAD5V8I1_9APHY|nr:hypothetical protein NLI96_g2363 [Physisporinus lineatus]